MPLDKSQLIKKQPLDLDSLTRTVGFRLAKTDEMSIGEYHQYLDAVYARKEQRRLRHTKKMIEMVDANNLPGTNEMLLFTRIVNYFERNHFLPGSYKDMLRKLIKGMKYDEIIPLEVQAMVFFGGKRKTL